MTEQQQSPCIYQHLEDTFRREIAYKFIYMWNTKHIFKKQISKKKKMRKTNDTKTNTYSQRTEQLMSEGSSKWTANE